MRISDWSSDVCTSDLVLGHRTQAAEVVDAVEDLTDHVEARGLVWAADAEVETHRLADLGLERLVRGEAADLAVEDVVARPLLDQRLVVFGQLARRADRLDGVDLTLHDVELAVDRRQALFRSEEHPSELQSLMRISYAVFRLKKKK